MFLNSNTDKFIPFTGEWRKVKVFNSRLLFAFVYVASIQLWFLGAIAEDIVRLLKEMDNPSVQSSHQKSFEIVTLAVIVLLFVILLYMVIVNKVNF